MMAFGDGHNDIEMLKVVGYPVVMENGSDEVKRDMLNIFVRV